MNRIAAVAVSLALTGCLATTEHSIAEVTYRGLQSRSGKVEIYERNGNSQMFDAPYVVATDGTQIVVSQHLYPTARFETSTLERVDTHERSPLKVAIAATGATLGVIGVIVLIITSASASHPSGIGLGGWGA